MDSLSPPAILAIIVVVTLVAVVVVRYRRTKDRQGPS